MSAPSTGSFSMPESLPAGRPFLAGAAAVVAHGLTDPGKARPANEDHFLIAQMTKALHVQQSSLPQPRTQLAAERGHLFVVADGMGGHRGGEHASALALETVEQFVLNTFKWFFHLQGGEVRTVLHEFKDALRLADVRIYEEAMRRPEFHGMGTTVTMAYALNTDLFVVHVGDSRCYLFREDRLHQVTQDHTLVGEMVRRGYLSKDEAAQHRLRHVVTNAVGGTERGVHVEVHKVGLEPGDRMLLCTDGLTEMVADERIAAALREEPEPARACARLVAEANAAGGKDNITVVVARFDEPG
jgi:protein phosphatase